MRSITIALLVASVALPAPMLKDREVFYHPIRVGDECVYEEVSNGEITEQKTTVVKAEKTSAGHIITVRWGDESDKPYQTRVIVTRNEVTELDGSASGSKQGASHIKLPAKEGLTWKFEPYGVNKPEEANSVCRVIGEEMVVTPAGKFKAIRVEVKTGPNGKFKDMTTWHASGVGMVKVDMKVGENRRTVILKSFKPGK
ncbi:hypothetical protein [Zavarzinella formosa]|uniref:hypothetical protein n=1 Tax=Zavarzinella formosa TaxID=360055 RepID=UPI0002EA3B41|nr:hypothetical protein [Zavarzinella formosa]